MTKKKFLLLTPTIGLILAIQAVIYFGAVIGHSQSYEFLSGVEKALLIAGLLGFFVFWFGMLAHYFLNRDLKHKVIWGFTLFFLSWLSALIYFFKYFVRDFFHEPKVPGPH